MSSLGVRPQVGASPRLECARGEELGPSRGQSEKKVRHRGEEEREKAACSQCHPPSPHGHCV